MVINMEQQNVSREKNIIKTSIIGIICNFLLAGVKATIGLISASISIVSDAVNNLTDSLSSTITIIGTKLSKKAPTKKHPFGYGRIEYLSSLIIAVIVFYVGITFLVESIKKIGNQDELNYKIIFLVVIGIAILVKVFLAILFIRNGKKNNSTSLVNSGKDALMDSIISLSTLISGIIFLTTGFSIEAYLGIVISLFILKNAFDMLTETTSSILGEKIDPEIAKGIKEEILQFHEVYGVYDLVMNNYGPVNNNASVHIEIAPDMKAFEIDKLTRDITYKIYEKYGIALTAIGVYAKELDDECLAIKNNIQKIVFSNKYVLEFHGFYIDHETKTIRFDIVVSLDAKDRNKEYLSICNMVKEAYPDYNISIVLDQYF